MHPDAAPGTSAENGSAGPRPGGGGAAPSLGVGPRPLFWGATVFLVRRGRHKEARGLICFGKAKGKTFGHFRRSNNKRHRWVRLPILLWAKQAKSGVLLLG